MRLVAMTAVPLLLLGSVLLLSHCENPSRGAPRPGPISGERALAHVREMVAFGPRPSASASLIKTRNYIESEIGKLGFSPVRDSFTFENAPGITFHNVSVEIPASRPGEERVLVLGSHYDTKLCQGHKEPWHNFEFVGANDGGSSSGLLLELARHFKAEPLPCRLLLVWFDGEECIEWDWNSDRALYGSRRLVKQLDKRFEGDLRDSVPVMVLLDMVGAKDLVITEDLNSSPRLVRIVKDVAEELGHGERFFQASMEVTDDHIPFLNYGIASLDLIHFGPPTPDWWHTESDTMDLLSAESLALVGHVVVEALPRMVREFYR